MRPVLAIFDGFFKDPARAHADIIGGDFGDFVSPWDSVKYPGINKGLPGWMMERVVERLEEVTAERVEPTAIFARVTSAATGNAPHRIHCDQVMGQYSAHVYLSKQWPDYAGTAFWNHKTEGQMLTDDTDVAQVMADSHLSDAWEKSFTCQGKFNRLLIHDSRLWHSAEPVGGWGDSPANGRVVLTCFFNTKVGA